METTYVNMTYSASKRNLKRTTEASSPGCITLSSVERKEVNGKSNNDPMTDPCCISDLASREADMMNT